MSKIMLQNIFAKNALIDQFKTIEEEFVVL